METLLIHLLKSSAVLLLFLGTYQVFLKKETFFTGNRFFLIFGLLTSFLFPFLTITKTVYVDRAPALQNDYIAVTTALTVTEQNVAFNWTNFLLLIYVIGVLCFSIRLAYQLYTIQKIKKSGEVRIEDNYYHVRTRYKISPFSFFKHIFYYPYQFTTTELNTILNHEKVHVRQIHSLDILLIEIALILQWFNPAIWLYKITVKQNLEFIADAEACSLDENKKEYQYLMLKQAMGNHKITIANPFFNSIIKKRIVMLNQNQSKPRQRLKQLLILPLLAVFLVAFNVKTEFKTKTLTDIKLVTAAENFNYQISKKSSETELIVLKKELADQGVDFSYTTVRNAESLVIAIDIDLTWTTNAGEKGKTTYSSDNTNKPIADISIKNKKDTDQWFIIPPKAIQNLKPPQKPSAPVLEPVTSTQLTNVTIEIDKTSATETLRKDADFLAERGIKVQFKGIKRNKKDEITAIKVSYDNGAGNKGNYQQRQNTPIDPFKVVINFKPNAPADILVVRAEEQVKATSIVWQGLDEIGKHDDIIIKESKTLEIKGDGSSKLIFLDGEQIKIDEFENEGQIEKIISTSIHNLEHYDDSTGTTVIDELKLKDEDGNEETMTRVKTSSNGKTKYVIVKKEKNVTDKEVNIHLDNDEYDHEENMVAIDAGDTETKKIKIKTKGKNPLYIIDGKEVSKKEFKKLSPDEIATINVYKGEKASEKYGRKAKDGVIDVVTKKK